MPVAATSCGVLTAPELPAAWGCPTKKPVMALSAAQLAGCTAPMLPVQLLPAKHGVLACPCKLYAHPHIAEHLCTLTTPRGQSQSTRLKGTSLATGTPSR